MSDTRRHTDRDIKGWGPGNQVFDHWNEVRSSDSYPPKLRQKKIMSAKHQDADRSHGSQKAKHRFVKGVKNSRHNLLRKVDELRLKEALTD